MNELFDTPAAVLGPPDRCYSQRTKRHPCDAHGVANPRSLQKPHVMLLTRCNVHYLYLCMLDARLFLSSVCFAFSSDTRLCRI